MAAPSDLNVRVGLILKDFKKSTKDMERMLQQTSDNIGNIADKMMFSITAPVLGIGAAAITAAGDFESLKLAMSTTMQDAGYSTQQTAAELEELRKIALAPGIDLDQAVKGSVRLQAVGIEAGKARDILKQFSNAIAAGGGGAEQLERVTLQLSQMSAKGVVLQEDLRVLKDALPGLSKAMMSAFGTTTAEGIRNAGVSANEFINGVTDQLAKNARVQGGVKNAIDNARSAMTQFLATIGDTINETYNLNQVAEDLSAWLGSTAAAFRNLDPETKKAILNFALYAAAAGPVLKIFSGLISGGAAVVNAVRMAGTAFANLSTGAIGLYDKFTKLSVAMKFTYIGAAIAIVGALYLGFTKLGEAAEAAMHTTRALNEVEKTANASISEQKVQTESLIGVLKSETTTRDAKLAAIKRLNEISPEYFNGLKLEGNNVRGLTEAYDGYIANLLKAARVKAAEEKLIEIDRKKLKLQEDLTRQEQSRAANFAATTGGLGSVTAFEQQNTNTKKQLVDDINREISAVNSEEQALRKVIEANLTLEPAQHKATAATASATETSKSKKKAVDEETASMKDLLKTLDILDGARDQEEKARRGGSGNNGNFSQLPQAQPAITSMTPQTGDPGDFLLAWADSLPTVTSAVSENFQKMGAIIRGWGEQANITGTEVSLMWSALGANFVALTESFSAGGAAQTAIFDAVGASIVDMTNSGSVNMKDFAKNAAASAIKVAKAYAVQGIFAAVSKALQNVPFPLNLAAAGAAAGIAGALLNGLANKIQAPKLAKGGLAYGTTTAIVGDNPGASVDPEVIAPLSKLKQYMGSGGPTDVRVYGEISGRVIKLLYDKEVNASKRSG